MYDVFNLKTSIFQFQKTIELFRLFTTKQCEIKVHLSVRKQTNKIVIIDCIKIK